MYSALSKKICQQKSQAQQLMCQDPKVHFAILDHITTDVKANTLLI